jgi:molybdenum ABC transporter molybdate-binding protein
MNAKAGALVLLLVLIGLCLLLLKSGPEAPSTPRPQPAGGRSGTAESTLLFYCAAGIKPPVEAAVKAYEAEYDVRVQMQYGGSGTLLSNLQVAAGDLYLAADASYIAIARSKGLVAEALDAAYLKGGIAVAKGNPKGITGLADLLRDDVSFALANPDAASVGKFTRKVLTEHGQWDAISKAAFVYKPTVTEVANDIKLGTLDAGIIWDATAAQYPEIDFVATPEFDAHRKTVTVGILTSSKQPTRALHFARYLTARDRGLTHFAAHQYPTIAGDVWADIPEILLFSGAMLRPAIQDAITAFEQREGCRITPVYNGCGVLVSQMKVGGENPDAYFSCDITFMDMVEDRFESSVVVSSNEMVILVLKGNPKQIKGVADLARPGLRLGLSHPEKSALGALTKNMLETAGVYADILAAGNLALDSPTGDFLVNQLRAESLDAVIVYRSNALAGPTTLSECDLIPITGVNAMAHQPYAVARDSGHQQLMQRFLEGVTQESGKKTFLSYGFGWELGRQ